MRRSPRVPGTGYGNQGLLERIQRKCGCGGSGGQCACPEERLQRQKSTGGAKGPSASVARALQGSGEPLPAGTRAQMESRFGHSFGGVRVHTGSEAAESARSVGALAYTVGEDVVFGAGRFQPGSAAGARLLAHELTHVVQQADGRTALQRAPAEEEGMTEEAGDATALDEEPAGEENDPVDNESGEDTDENSCDDEDAATEDEVGDEAVEQGEAGEPVTAAGETGAEGEEELQSKSEPGAAAWSDSPRAQALEAEADAVADRVVGGGSARLTPGAAAQSGLLQRKGPKKAAEFCGRPSARVADFPATFIKAIKVDLASPDHEVTLTWAGPSAGAQPKGPFKSSPGAGCCGKNCNDTATSKLGGSHCTPKGSHTVSNLGCKLKKYPSAKNVTYFNGRGVAFHHYDPVPAYPASHGCVRLDRGNPAVPPSRIIHDNARVNVTSVSVGGTWARQSNKFCWDCKKKKKTKGKSKP